MIYSQHRSQSDLLNDLSLIMSNICSKSRQGFPVIQSKTQNPCNNLKHPTQSFPLPQLSLYHPWPLCLAITLLQLFLVFLLFLQYSKQTPASGPLPLLFSISVTLSSHIFVPTNSNIFLRSLLKCLFGTWYYVLYYYFFYSTSDHLIFTHLFDICSSSSLFPLSCQTFRIRVS